MRQRKFSIIGGFIIMIAAASVYHAYTSYSVAEDDELFMANVEALADGDVIIPQTYSSYTHPFVMKK